MPHGKVLRVEKDGFGIVEIEGSNRFGFFTRERTRLAGRQPRVSVGDEVEVEVIDTGKDALVISRITVLTSARSAWRRLLDNLGHHIRAR
jgi:hypothetical protein